MKNLFVALSLLLIVASCTYNVSNAQTSGHAVDTLDDTQTPTNTISPTLQIPAVGK